MSAHITVERVDVALLRFQFDGLGYTRCGDHVDEWRGGVIRECEIATILRTAETDAPGLWVCDVCKRSPADWPRLVRAVECEIEHTPCRIF